MRFVQHRMLGHDCTARQRYTRNIRRWLNVSSVGDITALDKSVADDFAEMLELGLAESIEDVQGIYNYFRNDEGLNVHRSYGYLVNAAVGAQVAKWWRVNACT